MGNAQCLVYGRRGMLNRELRRIRVQLDAARRVRDTMGSQSSLAQGCALRVQELENEEEEVLRAIGMIDYVDTSQRVRKVAARLKSAVVAEATHMRSTQAALTAVMHGASVCIHRVQAAVRRAQRRPPPRNSGLRSTQSAEGGGVAAPAGVADAVEGSDAAASPTSPFGGGDHDGGSSDGSDVVLFRAGEGVVLEADAESLPDAPFHARIGQGVRVRKRGARRGAFHALEEHDGIELGGKHKEPGGAGAQGGRRRSKHGGHGRKKAVLG